ncbi:MAG: hypothetical protein SF162_17450 [bacterium]|nr:hypothetical protein [bacterium]
MQNTAVGSTHERAQRDERHSQLTITREGLAYLLLIVLVLLFRFAELDRVPLSRAEAAQANTAYALIEPRSSLEPARIASPLLFALQSISMGLLGGSEAAARSLTVLGAVGLVFSPLLFRSRLGKGQTLLLCLILAVSPSLFAASRASSGAIWSALLVVIGLWAAYQTVISVRREAPVSTAFPSVLIVTWVAAAILAEPGGLILVAIAAGAGVIAALTGRAQNEAVFRFEDEMLPQMRTNDLELLARRIPWATAIGAAVITVIVVSTAFMSHPSGLANVGELLTSLLAGFGPREPGAAPFLPLTAALFYEPFLWLFGVVAVITAISRRRVRGVTRFMMAWTGLALIASVVYRGATAEHALWFVLPLSVLTSQVIADLFADDVQYRLWEVPTWARWIVTVSMLSILAVFTLALHDVARSLLNAPNGSLQNLALDQASVVLVLIPILFSIITFFLIASVWNERPAFQGIALAIFIFGMVGSLGSGWRIAVDGVENANELWHTTAYSRNLFLLRETLLEIDRREGGGFGEVEIVSVVGESPEIAWLLRDFRDARSAVTVREAIGAPVILTETMPVEGTTDDVPETLFSNYVGQDFTVSRTWLPETLLLTELPAWWTQGRTLAVQTSSRQVILWVRSDIYQGLDFETGGVG